MNTIVDIAERVKTTLTLGTREIFDNSFINNSLVLMANYWSFTVLVATISRPGMNEVWLASISGAVLVTLLALQVTLSIHLASLTDINELDYSDEASMTPDEITRSKDLRTGGPLAAAWTVCFFIYTSYALLPIRLRHACIAGIIFSVAHLVDILLLYRTQDYPLMMTHVSLFFIINWTTNIKLCFFFNRFSTTDKTIFFFYDCHIFLNWTNN